MKKMLLEGLNPSKILVLGFALVIFVGTFF